MLDKTKLACVAACAMAGTAQAASTLLVNGSLRTTIHDSGNFDSVQLPGLEYRGHEIVTIGDPSSWYWFSAGGTQYVAQYNSNPFGAVTIGEGPDPARPDSATTSGAAGGWSIYQTVMPMDSNTLIVYLRLTNNTGAEVRDAYWGVGFDPDQDRALGTGSTENLILGTGWNPSVWAYGPRSGVKVTLEHFGVGNGSVVPFINVGDCCSPVDPVVAHERGQPASFSSFGDDSIGLSYALGDFYPGQWKEIAYTYTFFAATVPEPGSAALMLGGIALLAARRLRRAD